MGRPLKNIRWTAALAVQAGSRMLLDLNGHSDEEHNLSPSQRVAFLVTSVGLVMMAGLMSGLTLGLMSMDLVELEVLKRSGTATEQLYAAAIMPIVSNQHFLLVTLLLCNAAAMEALPLFLDRLADPVTAILISVTAVLVFGEILPQAVCSRYGLAIGYYCAWFVRGLMALTSPLSWPIGKLLDFLLGSEHRALFRRGQLKALVDIHGASEGLGGNLSEDEIKVICGALDLTNKTARKSMTPLNKVFMLPADARLNRTTMRSILASGHSRIPVYAGGDRSNVIGLILVKELLQYKTHQEVPVSDVRMRSLPRLPADTPMYDMLKLFQTGRSHMVVLTDTPETARRAAEAAAAAKAAAEAAEAQEADSDKERGSPNRLGSMLRGGNKRKERHQFHSPLLQPITPEEPHSPSSSPDRDSAARGGAWIANDSAQQPSTARGLSQPPDFTQPSLDGQSNLAASSRSGAVSSHQAPPMEQELVPGSPSVAHDRSAGFSSSSRKHGSQSVVTEDSGASARRAVQFDRGTAAGPNGTQAGEQQQSDASSIDPLIDSVEKLRSNSRGSMHNRSLSGPLPSVTNPLLLGGVTTPENGPEGVAMPIGIISIEDVIEELMQAEIVDETDLFIDNERSVAVNAAELARTLPAQLRLALAPITPRGVSPAVSAAAARVTVRKLIKQKSSGALGAIAGVGNVGGAGGMLSPSTSNSGAAVLQRGRPASDQGVVNPGVLQRNRAASDQGVIRQGSGSGSGVVGTVSASLAAAAAAVTGGTVGGGRGRAGERQPLLPGGDRSAPA